eukprot:Skav223061  [mRNA]  locus=scaffold1069:453384:454902:+ [translate_table: standard]
MSSKRPSALAARWEAGGQITMGALGRDRRVRRSVAKLSRSARKSRQPGARAETSGEESEEVLFVEPGGAEGQEELAQAPGLGCEEEVPVASASKRIPYTNPAQEEAGRERGRRKLLGRTALSSRVSLDTLISAQPKDLAEQLMSSGFLVSEPTQFCKCKDVRLVLEARDLSCFWRCKGCRKSRTVLHEDLDLFEGKLPLRSFASALWLRISKLNLSPDNCSLIMNVDNRTIRGLFDRFDQFFVRLISRMNDELQLGGLGEDVEMDEIAFRSVTVLDQVHWIRFLAAAKRGSSFVHLYKLTTRVTASGQGGGGPLSLEELGPALRIGTHRPLLKVGSVVHTDSAKAYKHLSEDEVLQTWMVNGVLASFEDLKLGHTNVRHKPPHPEFSKVLQTRVWNGAEFLQESRVGGTLEVRRLFCKLPARGRAGVEDLWNALSAFCPQAAPAEVSEGDSELYSGD